MWRWVLGIVAAISLLLIGTCWFGYKKIAGAGNVASTTVAASTQQVWEYFTVPDSIIARQDSASTLWISRDSSLQVGDSVRMQSRAGGQTSSMTWTLDRMEPPTLLVWSARDDSLGYVVVQRTDSIIGQGDSVRIVSVFESPLMDSLGTGDSVSGMGRFMMRGLGNIATGGMRLAGEMELRALKLRIDGTP